MTVLFVVTAWVAGGCSGGETGVTPTLPPPVSTSGTGTQPPGEGAWTVVTGMEPRTFPRGVEVGGQAIVVGGSGGNDLVADLVAFSSQGSATVIGRLSTPRQSHRALSTMDGRIVVAGGVNENGPMETVEVIEPSGASTLVPLEASRGVGTDLVLIAPERVLVAGGDRDGVLEILDLSTMRVREVGHLPDELRAAAVQLLPLHQGAVLIAAAGAFAWYDVDSASFSSVQLFDGASSGDESPQITRLVSGDVLATGGCCTSEGQALSDAWLIRPDRTLTRLPAMASGRFAHSSTLLRDGRVLITGGSAGRSEGGAFGGMREVEIYDPRSGRFVHAPPMYSPRAGHDAVELGDGSVLVVGVSDYHPDIAAAEVFVP